MLYIIRNNKQYGPYDENVVAEYVNQGSVVEHDVARDADSGETATVAFFLRRKGIKTYVRHDGGVLKQLRKIGSDLIVPKESLVNREWMQDKRLLVLAIVGLFPSLMLLIPMPEIGVFYIMALYFSAIWGLFFYYFFKTSQVTLRTTITVFFLTHIFVFVVWDIFGLVRFNPFYALTEAPFPIDLLGFVFGVGLTEELAKMVPLFIILSRAKEPLVPRTLVFYGLIRQAHQSAFPPRHLVWYCGLFPRLRQSLPTLPACPLFPGRGHSGPAPWSLRHVLPGFHHAGHPHLVCWRVPAHDLPETERRLPDQTEKISRRKAWLTHVKKNISNDYLYPNSLAVCPHSANFAV